MPSVFFESFAPKAGGKPSGALAAAIDSAFGSFDAFKGAFSAEVRLKRRDEAGPIPRFTFSPACLQSLACFGSGWVWLVVDTANGGALKIVTTANQARDRWRTECAYVPFFATPSTVRHAQETPASDPSKKPILVIDLWEHVSGMSGRSRVK